MLNMNIYEPINTNYLNRSHVTFLIFYNNELLDMLKQGKPLTCSFFYIISIHIDHLILYKGI